MLKLAVLSLLNVRALHTLRTPQSQYIKSRDGIFLQNGHHLCNLRPYNCPDPTLLQCVSTMYTSIRLCSSTLFFPTLSNGLSLVCITKFRPPSIFCMLSIEIDHISNGNGARTGQIRMVLSETTVHVLMVVSTLSHSCFPCFLVQ